ncbi:hypothetical protein RB195_001058 [Necator americanus]|uniref:Uncharacterized protein n=1 Tax=Necator americanus TaxID=51031 RepID=A0ABR1DCJ1_NECAM
MDTIDEEYDRLVEHLHDCAKKAESFRTTKKRLSLKTLELMRQRGAAQAAGNQARRPSSQGFAERRGFPVRNTTRYHVGKKSYAVRSRQNKARTPEEPSASTHQHPGEALYTLPVEMQDS